MLKKRKPHRFTAVLRFLFFIGIFPCLSSLAGGKVQILPLKKHAFC
jgi:hypothetical protein